MEVTKKDLKKLIHKFLVSSNRILTAKYDDYTTELSKFIKFIESNEIIYAYIKSCGTSEYDVKEIVKKVENSFGRNKFYLGKTTENEVANIYYIIKYLAENNYNGTNYVYYGYSNSNKYQDKIDAFGNEFIRILIIHIENYLREIAIDMEIDDKTTVNVNIENSNLNNAQVNISSEKNNINISKDNIDTQNLQELINDLLCTIQDMKDNDKEIVEDCLETIKSFSKDKSEDRKVRMALSALKGICHTGEFLSAVTKLSEFIENLFN